MSDTDSPSDQANIEALLATLPFVQTFAIRIVSFGAGGAVVDMPFDDRFSGPPSQFPASMVGALGDVAAVTSCLTLLPKGWALATLDFTVKMTGAAKGDRLRAKGRVLQAGRTNSVGAADVYAVRGDTESLCGTVLATTRNYQIK